MVGLNGMPWYVSHSAIAACLLTLLIAVCMFGLIRGAAALNEEMDRDVQVSHQRPSGHAASEAPRAHLRAVPALRTDQQGRGGRPRLDPATAQRKRIAALVEPADPLRI